MSYLSRVINDILELVEVFDRVKFILDRACWELCGPSVGLLYFFRDSIFFSIHILDNIVATVGADLLALQCYKVFSLRKGLVAVFTPFLPSLALF